VGDGKVTICKRDRFQKTLAQVENPFWVHDVEQEKIFTIRRKEKPGVGKIDYGLLLETYFLTIGERTGARTRTGKKTLG